MDFFKGSTDSDTIESARIWMDHAEGLPLPQFLGEWGFVSFDFRKKESNLIFILLITINCIYIYIYKCIYIYIFTDYNSYFAVRSLVFIFRRELLKIQPEVNLMVYVVLRGLIFSLYYFIWISNT